MQPTKPKLLLSFLIVLCIAFPVIAHDYVPGTSQDKPIMLKGGNIYTISDGIIENADLLFENGIITQIGENIDPPEGAEVIDVTGKNVYPGIIAPNTVLGLIEIGAVDATNDKAERGKNNPDLQSRIAYNPDSEVIPTVRSNGITTALIVPQGSLLRGRSSLLNLDAWTEEDAMVKKNLGLHLKWPKASIVSAWWIKKSAEDQKKENAENRQEIYGLFDKAVAYKIGRESGYQKNIDSRLESMIPVLTGEMMLFVHANDPREMEQAISFGSKYGCRIVIIGGRDAWMIADILKENNIPIILGTVQSSAGREDEAYDIRYRQPAKLQQAGVQFCFGIGSYTSERNLPFQAGQAVSFGLSHEDALRALTLSTAEILGVSEQLGSLEIGKSATIIVSSGDLIDISGNDIILEFIDGRKVDLDDKQKELYRKYRQKELSK